MKKLIVLIITTLLFSCQPSLQHSLGGVDDSSNIELVEVVNSLKEYRVNLVKKAPKEKNDFGQKLKGVLPARYTLDDKDMFIYIFGSEENRKEGEAEFSQKTSDMKLVSYDTYTKRNVLIYYVHEEEMNSLHTSHKTDIQVALDSIEEG
ncbi:hypothetical protein [Mangrovibacillus cuniculi]|uniref:Lipoprotein n=1 Tax=Mangrovibacillus cuniculi TaxID=2593652 RepID=A0A7S8CE62_9BACI|nr:hypothetical protein [Mangrovibacillus cuniculi]QPC48251.1 hypothetical protein G8O30_15655 [Mangrovibacillus cuniculi]